MRINKTKSSIENIFWGITNRLLSLIFPFIIRTIIIKKLGAEYTGLSSLFTSVFQVLSLAELGFGSSIVFAMYEPIAKNQFEKIGALLLYYKKVYTIIGLLVLSIGLILLPFIPKLISGNVPNDVNLYYLFFIYLVNSVLSYFFFAYRASLLTAYQKESINSKINSSINFIMYILQIIVLVIYKNYYFYIILLPFFTMLYNLVRYMYVLREYPYIEIKGIIDYEEKKKIRKNIFALFLHKIGGIAVNTIDNIVISFFLGLLILSNYNNYYYLLSAVTSLITIFFSSLTAGIGNSVILDDNNRVKENFFAIFYINGVIVSVCTVCFFSMYQDFISLWVGKQYLFSIYTMILFCFYFFIHTIRRTVIMYRDASGQWRDNQWQPIVASFVNFILNIILIKIIGINGILISTLISMILVDMPWEGITICKNLLNTSSRLYFRWIFIFFISTVSSCMLIFITSQLLMNITIYLRLFINFFISITIPCIILLILFNKFPYKKRIMEITVNILKRV